jgi:hypothetical protein
MLPPFIRENFPEFPDDMPIPNIMRQVMQSNNSFQADIRLFQEDLAAGRYDPKWLEDAQEAMEKRAQGHFDDWKERNREEFWGQKQKVDWTTLSGDSAQYTLVDLVKAGLFEVGDIWSMKRGGQGVKVEKEAKVSRVLFVSACTIRLTRCIYRSAPLQPMALCRSHIRPGSISSRRLRMARTYCSKV